MVAQRRSPDTEATVISPWDAPEPQPAGGETNLDWRRYLSAVRQRWWIIAVAVAVAVVGAGLFTIRQPKLFRGEASLIIDTRMPKVLTGVEEVSDVAASGWVPPNFFETEYEVLRSRQVALVAAERLGIANDDSRNGLSSITDPAERQKALAALDPATLVFGRYSVEPDKRSNIVRVVVVDTDPKFAADLANAVADAYRSQNLDKRVDETRDASKWLGVQHDDLKKKLRDSEDALIAFLDGNDILNASLDSQLAEVKQRLDAFNTQLAAEEAARIRDTLNVEALKQVREDPDLVDTLPEIQQASVITALKTRLIELKSLQVDLTARYLPDHPKMKLLEEQRATVAADLKREIDAMLTALERQKASRESAIVGLKTALAEEREKEARLNKLGLDYARLKRERDSNAELFDMVTTRMKEADITSALPFNNVRLLDRALVPTAPFKPNLKQNLVFGLLFGLLVGVSIILLLEVLDTTIKSQEDVEKIVDSPFLGLLPIIGSDEPKKGATRAEELAAMRARDLVVIHEPRSSAAECARFIRTNLLFMSPDRPLKTLVVTSPSPQEGKTTTATSIAITMAQAGSRTLIVDTDLRKPRLHRVFDVDSETGVSSVLVGEAPLEKAIRKTQVDKLDVLPCGPLPPNPAELLLSERFRELVADLGKRYDRVIFDTPPMGPVTDPAILGALVDGVVLVVKCDKTSKEAARQAVRLLKDANAHVFGVILNDVNVASRRYSGAYSSYYSRRYGGYYGEEEPQGTAGAPPA